MPQVVGHNDNVPALRWVWSATVRDEYMTAFSIHAGRGYTINMGMTYLLHVYDFGKVVEEGIFGTVQEALKHADACELDLVRTYSGKGI